MAGADGTGRTAGSAGRAGCWGQRCCCCGCGCCCCWWWCGCCWWWTQVWWWGQVTAARLCGATETKSNTKHHYRKLNLTMKECIFYSQGDDVLATVALWQSPDIYYAVLLYVPFCMWYANWMSSDSYVWKKWIPVLYVVIVVHGFIKCLFSKCRLSWLCKGWWKQEHVNKFTYVV